MDQQVAVLLVTQQRLEHAVYLRVDGMEHGVGAMGEGVLIVRRFGVRGNAVVRKNGRNGGNFNNLIRV